MTETLAHPLARPTWQRLRLWVVLALIVVIGAVFTAFVTRASSSSAPALDPTSPAHDGSLAVARLLDQRGTTVTRLTAPSAAAATPPSTSILIVAPDDLGPEQLQALHGHRLIVIEPGITALAALSADYERNAFAGADPVEPQCGWAGAPAAGRVSFPAGTATYSGPSTCYGGAVVVTDQLVILGSADVLRNDELANNNVAALVLNAVSADGSVTDVAWLLPGVEDTGSGSPSVWDLFPPWAQRAFWWLLVVGVLLALWRGRRLGPVVREPLPVIVRSAEVVEGHGRLYRRAGARGQAAALLRAATVRRLATHLGLDRRTSATEVATLVAAHELLLGPAPADDPALLTLAHDLATLEAQEGSR